MEVELKSRIKAFVFDIDGVLASEVVIQISSTQVVRMYNSKDGFALQLANKLGYKIGIITGANLPEEKKRYEQLCDADVYLGASHKESSYLSFLEKHQLKSEDVAYMGDDLPDIVILEQCGLACCPNDAVEEVKNVCDMISVKNGGQGCVRNLIELVLKAQGDWDQKEHWIW